MNLFLNTEDFVPITDPGELADLFGPHLRRVDWAQVFSGADTITSEDVPHRHCPYWLRVYAIKLLDGTILAVGLAQADGLAKMLESASPEHAARVRILHHLWNDKLTWSLQVMDELSGALELVAPENPQVSGITPVAIDRELINRALRLITRSTDCKSP